MSDKKLKGVWVDGALWECKELSLQEKHFLQKIKDLDNEHGCYANNAFFADFFGISKGRCTQVIDKLVDKKFISKKLEKKGVLVTRRVLRILNKGVKLFKQGGVKDSKLGVYYSKQEEFKILKDSNTDLLNNRIKNLEERERKALSHIKELELEIEQLKTELKNKEKSPPKKESETSPPPTGENNQAAKRKTAKRKNKGDWTQLDITLHNLTLPEKWTEPLKEKVLEYWYYMDEKKGANWGTTQTIIRQRDAVTNHLQKFSISEIVDSLEEAMLKGNASYNPSWTKNRKDKAEKESPIKSSNPLFMGSESLNHRNTWNK